MVLGKRILRMAQCSLSDTRTVPALPAPMPTGLVSCKMIPLGSCVRNRMPLAVGALSTSSRQLHARKTTPFFFSTCATSPVNVSVIKVSVSFLQGHIDRHTDLDSLVAIVADKNVVVVIEGQL